MPQRRYGNEALCLRRQAPTSPSAYTDHPEHYRTGARKRQGTRSTQKSRKAVHAPVGLVTTEQICCGNQQREKKKRIQVRLPQVPVNPPIDGQMDRNPSGQGNAKILEKPDQS